MSLRRVARDAVTLEPGIFQFRAGLVRSYVAELRTQNLLQNHLFEAALWNPNDKPEDAHWGWETPTSQVRGQFLGHWMSAASQFAATGDEELRGRVLHVVRELGRCQQANGGEWVASIPEKYLRWVAEGRSMWASNYVVHKTLMGVLDVHQRLGDEQALEIVRNAARWYTRWLAGIAEDDRPAMLDQEMGGLMELWADLYAITGEDEHRALMEAFAHRQVFDRLLAGDDPLTNRHANTTIPEVMGAARAWEVTGDARWREITEAYWRCAVTDRGTFVTGGQTHGEVWTPPYSFASRLGRTNQEHCVVFNMMRLADRLFRWTGDPAYADYLERNLYNGVLAQQHPVTGMVSYYLPLHPGARKTWTTRTGSFPCCQGTLVQAGSLHGRHAYYESDDGLAIALYQPSTLRWAYAGTPVTVRTVTPETWRPSATMSWDPEPVHRPATFDVRVEVKAERATEFALALRVPGWADGPVDVRVNGASVVKGAPGSTAELRRSWHDDTVELSLPRRVTAHPLPDAPGLVAFAEGPVALAALTDRPHTLPGPAEQAAALLEPADEREWFHWTTRFRADGLSFVPLHEVVDDPYTVYLPVGR